MPNGEHRRTALSFETGMQGINTLAALTSPSGRSRPGLQRILTVGGLQAASRLLPTAFSRNIEKTLQHSLKLLVEDQTRSDTESRWLDPLWRPLTNWQRPTYFDGFHPVSESHLFVAPFQGFGEAFDDVPETLRASIRILPEIMPPGPDESITVMMPAPFVSEMVRSARDGLPSAIAWDSEGACTFVRAERLPEFASAIALPSFEDTLSLRGMFRERDDEVIDQTVYECYGRLASKKRRRILQLSDLHFGTVDASYASEYLLALIRSQFPMVNRVILTGDLLDQPTSSNLFQFERFTSEIAGTVGEDPILIPGNHDQRWHGVAAGSFGRNEQFTARLFTDQLIVDNQIGAVFFCFNTSESGILARGGVSKRQRLEMAAKDERALAENPKVARYRRIALIHHHPLSIQHERAASVLQMARGILRPEFTREMKGGRNFVRWCAERNAKLILHGHRHLSRHALGIAPPRRDTSLREVEVDIVGCGSSTGKNDHPINVNVVEWDLNELGHSVTFYEDPGDGSSLVEKAVHQERAVRV